MCALKYRVVTNWPASMSEDFTFDPTEDRNAHYDLCVEILSCIADERHPGRFRLSAQTIYEYDVKRPVEPSLPRMPLPAEAAEGDSAFMDLCTSYTFTGRARFARQGSFTHTVRVQVTECFELEGDELERMAKLAKRDRAQAKFRFIMASYGVAEDEISPISDGDPNTSPLLPLPANDEDKSSESPKEPASEKKRGKVKGKKGKKGKKGASKKSAGKGRRNKKKDK